MQDAAVTHDQIKWFIQRIRVVCVLYWFLFVVLNDLDRGNYLFFSKVF